LVAESTLTVLCFGATYASACAERASARVTYDDSNY